jgi:hypothetical protein
MTHLHEPRNSAHPLIGVHAGLVPLSPNPMHILFVDGIGSAQVLRSPLLKRLRADGHTVSHHGYFSFAFSMAALRAQLTGRIASLADAGDYALIGYSFGGVLARAALVDTALAGVPQPRHLFLLGSPLRALRISRRFGDCTAYRWLTGEAGQWLRSSQAMRSIVVPALPTTCIVGTRGGLNGRLLGGLGRAGDGMVADQESCPHRFLDVVRLPCSHATLPAHPDLAPLILSRLPLPCPNPSPA